MANFKYKKNRKHRLRGKFFCNYYWNFKRSFKLDYILKGEFKKALKNKTII